MSAIRKNLYTLEEYFALEKRSSLKHEYRNGEIFVMSGAQPNHNRVAVNVISELRFQLKSRSCEVFGSDQRVKVHVASPYLYPDASVACPKPEFQPISGLLTLTNPSLIIEVLSPTTADDDRGAKFIQYQTIPTLQEYLLIDPDMIKITHYIKQPDNMWRPLEITDLTTTIELPAISCSLLLTEIYRNVELA